VLGPLAGLLLLSRPVTLWERLTFVAAAAWAGVWFTQTGGLGHQLERSATALLVGAFLALTLWRPLPLFTRAAGAVAATTAALGLWAVVWRLSPSAIAEAVVRERWAEHRLEAAQVNELVSIGLLSPERGRDLVEQMAWQVESSLPVLPALWALAALLGLAVAWAVYHRIAREPWSPAPGRLADFRFSDQLVWLVVLGIGVLLVPGAPVLDLVGRNLLVLAGALYAVRGVAVFLTAASGTPRPIVATVGVASLLLFPFTAGGLTLLGLVDTWLDFRRRLASSPTGGMDR
jgi:hypothetical protein